MPMDAATAKDQPLKEDTRLLGRVLGEVIRAQTGEAGFARIEAIRQTAIRFHRASGDDAAATRDQLAALMNPLPIADVLHVVRAFSYFSHLANIAEDVHQNRRRRAHALAGSPPQRGSIAQALERLAAAGIDGGALSRWFADALVSPVLTAHPTEVQRKSILDAEREIVRLLVWRDRVALTPDEAAEFSTALYRQVLELWQTAMLRLSRLQVKDEIDNGLAYYRYTFLDQVPRLYADLGAHLTRDFGIDGSALPPFLRPGSWIGGDRDGNPHVDAETLDYAIRAQSALAFEHYLGEVHRLGAELSLSSRLIQPTPKLLALAAQAHDENPHRQDEPYRNALVGVYARLAATARVLSGYSPPGRRRSRGHPTPVPPPFGRTSIRLRHRLRPTARHRYARAGSIRCVGRSMSSASTSRCSTCGRTATCTRRSSPSCWRAQAWPLTMARSTRRRASICWRASSPDRGSSPRRTSTTRRAPSTSSPFCALPPTFTRATAR